MRHFLNTLTAIAWLLMTAALIHYWPEHHSDNQDMGIAMAWLASTAVYIFSLVNKWSLPSE